MILVTEQGVKPDGTTLNTERLQKLIDQCGAGGGGTLHFPPGRYLTGGLEMRSHTTLQLESGAVLLGSPDLSHYRHWHPSPIPFHEGVDGVRALIFALDSENIRLVGQGVVDGQGAALGRGCRTRAGRPRTIWFGTCRNVVVDGLHLRNSGFWMQHYATCQNLRLANLDIWNHGGSNNDGIDIDGCRDVFVHNCRIDSADDAICLKAGHDTPTENVVITGCSTRSHCNHFKLGTESNGGFRNILVEGLIMTASEHRESHVGTEGADYRGACGVALASVDGGCLENIVVRNLSMDGVRVPFFIRLGDRGRPSAPGFPAQPVAFARDVAISGIRARHASSAPCHVSGLPDAPLGNVTVEDCDFEFAGGGDPATMTRDIPLNRNGYPSMEMFGPLPAYGLFARDVEGLRLRNLRFRLESPDPRPAIAWRNCRHADIDGVVAD